MSTGAPFPQPPEDLAAQAEALVQRARSLTGELELLRNGWEDSVAAHFGVSGFVVHEARRLLDDEKTTEAS
jgi:hypothetical protein